MRSTSSVPSGAAPQAASAALAHARRRAALGTPREETANCTAIRARPLLGRICLALLRFLFVGIDDARDQGMSYDVLRAELGERDPAHVGENAARLDETALLLAREVDLG